MAIPKAQISKFSCASHLPPSPQNINLRYNPEWTAKLKCLTHAVVLAIIIIILLICLGAHAPKTFPAGELLYETALSERQKFSQTVAILNLYAVRCSRQASR